jgi:hypothetical protein
MSRRSGADGLGSSSMSSALTSTLVLDAAVPCDGSTRLRLPSTPSGFSPNSGLALGRRRRTGCPRPASFTCRSTEVRDVRRSRGSNIADSPTRRTALLRSSRSRLRPSPRAPSAAVALPIPGAYPLAQSRFYSAHDPFCSIVLPMRRLSRHCPRPMVTETDEGGSGFRSALRFSVRHAQPLATALAV